MPCPKLRCLSKALYQMYKTVLGQGKASHVLAPTPTDVTISHQKIRLRPHAQTHARTHAHARTYAHLLLRERFA